MLRLLLIRLKRIGREFVIKDDIILYYIINKGKVRLRLKTKVHLLDNSEKRMVWSVSPIGTQFMRRRQ